MNWRFFVVLMLAVSAGAHLYIGLKLRSALGVWWGWGFLLKGVFWTAMLFCARRLSGRVGEALFALSFAWLAVVVITFVCFVAAGLLAFAARPFLHSPVTARTTAVCALTASLLLLCWTLFEAWNVRRVDVQLATAKLPPGVERLRIVQLSDVHLGGVYTVAHLQRALAIVRESSPDLLVMTGDLVDGNMAFRERERLMLAETAALAKYGAFAVNGNHEHYNERYDPDRFIASSGFRLLVDEAVHAAGITIIGSEERQHGYLKPYDGFAEGEFVLLLKHQPGLPLDAAGRFDLQLSGHTHDGQLWPLGYIASSVLGSTQGLSSRAGGSVYVSNGTGFFGLPMRFLAPPEVTVIDLVRKKP